MKVTVSSIRQFDRKGWLIIEDGFTKTTVRMDINELSSLANGILWAIKRYSRDDREWINGCLKQLTESNDENSK